MPPSSALRICSAPDQAQPVIIFIIIIIIVVIIIIIVVIIVMIIIILKLISIDAHLITKLLISVKVISLVRLILEGP